MHCVGWCFENGLGVARDVDLAFDWYFAAANNGSVGAMVKVSECFLFGHGTPLNHERAFDWCLKAAEGGHKVHEPPCLVLFQRTRNNSRLHNGF